MNIDIYNLPCKTVNVLCHTTLGDTNDKLGRFFLKGKEYKLVTEKVNPSQDTKWEDCILCWVNQTDGFGSRFAVKGNIYQYNDKTYWPHFSDYFVCPIQRERDNKLTEIGIQ